MPRAIALLALCAANLWAAPGCQRGVDDADVRPADRPARPFIEVAPTAPKVSLAVEREPNNARAQATALEPNEPIQGYIGDPNDQGEPDQDWFAVDVGDGAPILARVTLEGADDLDLVLEWMTRGGTKDELRIQADHHIKTPGPEVLPNLKLEPGTSFFRVREAWYRGKPRRSSEIPYRLRVDTSRWSSNVESEPNGTPDRAVESTVSRTDTGVLSHARDVDLWRLQVPALLSSERLTLEVTPPAGVNTYVAVSWSSHPTHTVSHSPPAGRPAVFKNLYPPDASSQLMIKLKSSGPTSPSSPYRIVSHVVDGQAPETETEPNNLSASSTAFTLSRAITGIFSPPDDVDFHSFKLTTDALVSFSGTLPTGCQLNASVTQKGGALVGSFTYSHPSPQSESPRLLLRAGGYDLELKGDGTCQAAPYTITTSTEHLGDDDEREDNGDQTSASVVRLREGIEHRGWLFPGTDVDWWALDLSDNEQGHITTLHFNLQAQAGVKVSLVNHEGVAVIDGRALHRSGPSTLTHFLAPGRYGIKVEKTEIDAISGMLEYGIRVLAQ